MDLGIKGRRAIVTGGGSGIGFETARQFLEEGVRVLIAGRTADKINKARDDLADENRRRSSRRAGRHAEGSRHQADGRYRKGKTRRRRHSRQQCRHDVFRPLCRTRR